MATKAKRREPTEEQKARAAERRDRFKAIAQAVAAMSDAERLALVSKLGAIVNCEGRPLSMFNACLLVTQFPTVSMVGGFQQWKRAGRCVRKGERGLSLWIPKHKGGDAEGGPADASHGGEPISDSKEDGRTRFLMGTVFDVSQTEPEGATPCAAPVCSSCGCEREANGCPVCGAV